MIIKLKNKFIKIFLKHFNKKESINFNKKENIFNINHFSNIEIYYNLSEINYDDIELIYKNIKIDNFDFFKKYKIEENNKIGNIFFHKDDLRNHIFFLGTTKKGKSSNDFEKKIILSKIEILLKEIQEFKNNISDNDFLVDINFNSKKNILIKELEIYLKNKY